MQIFSQPYRRTTDRLSVSMSRIEEPLYRLVLQSMQNAAEILYRLSAMLYVYQWDIKQADVRTLEDDRINDVFIIQPGNPAVVDELLYDQMFADLESLYFRGEEVDAYLVRKNKPLPEKHSIKGKVNFQINTDSLVVTVKSDDRPGLLFSLTGVFARESIDIAQAEILTEDDGRIVNRFIIPGRDKRFQNAEYRSTLNKALLDSL